MQRAPPSHHMKILPANYSCNDFEGGALLCGISRENCLDIVGQPEKLENKKFVFNICPLKDTACMSQTVCTGLRS